jgi:hypothetical protein
MRVLTVEEWIYMEGNRSDFQKYKVDRCIAKTGTLFRFIAEFNFWKKIPGIKPVAKQNAANGYAAIWRKKWAEAHFGNRIHYYVLGGYPAYLFASEEDIAEFTNFVDNIVISLDNIEFRTYPNTRGRGMSWDVVDNSIPPPGYPFLMKE